jgi:hypothetical protein
MIAPIEGFCNMHIEPIPEARKLTVKMRLDHLLVQGGLARSAAAGCIIYCRRRLKFIDDRA